MSGTLVALIMAKEDSAEHEQKRKAVRFSPRFGSGLSLFSAVFCWRRIDFETHINELTLCSLCAHSVVSVQALEVRRATWRRELLSLEPFVDMGVYTKNRCFRL